MRAALVLFAAPVVLVLLAAGLWLAALAEAERADGLGLALSQALARQPQAPAVRAAGLLLPGQSAGLQASALQEELIGLAAGVDLRQVEMRGTTAEGALTRRSAHLSFTAAEAPAMQLILALETARPLVFVDALQVTAAEDGSLTVEADVSALAGGAP